MTASIASWIDELTRFPLRATDDDSAGLEQRRREAKRAFGRSLPLHYRWARLDHSLLARRVRLTTLPANSPHGRAVFFGPPGSGKTSLATALLRSAATAFITTTVLRSDEDADRIAMQFHFADARELAVSRLSTASDGTAAIRVAMQAEILLLDDLGRECAIPSSPISDIIAARHADERATWVTTELMPKEVAVRYGGGAARRVFEGAQRFEFAGR